MESVEMGMNYCRCGAEPILESMGSKYFVFCDECDLETPAYYTDVEAIIAWNEGRFVND